MSPPTPHPANAPGDFYVEEGCCITCGVPLEEAPDVFAWVGEPNHTHCVVANQPQTSSALDRTLVAMWAGEVQCIRYQGIDAEIVRRIVEMGNADLCDESIATGAAPLVRSHVSFSVDEDAFVGPQQMAVVFLRHFDHQHSYNADRQVREVHSDDMHATVQVSWFRGVFHTIAFERLAKTEWHVATKPGSPQVGIGLSRLVERWLRGDERFREIRWFSEDQWQSGQSSRPTVI